MIISCINTLVLLLSFLSTFAQRTCMTDSNIDWRLNANGKIFEYAAYANPKMSEIPVRVFPPELHETGESKVVELDLSKELELDYPATSPNLLANFVRINTSYSLSTSVAVATSQVFYVIRGTGSSITRNGTIEWSTGDMFVVPFLGDETPPVCEGDGQCVLHKCNSESITGGCAIYWVNDSPLLRYLGVRPFYDGKPRFLPSFFDHDTVRNVVNKLESVDISTGLIKNRRGVLFGNNETNQTKTLTPSLWSLLNVISPNEIQRAHKHNSVALDLAVYGGDTDMVWTSMGSDLGLDGEIINPIRINWKSGGVFVTPPGWWHSHHNTGETDAWVLPIQDAGLYTHQRTLDIRFADEESKRLIEGRNRGATLMN